MPNNIATPRMLLTEREAEVLALMAQGANDQEVASALFIATSTLKHHVVRLFKKIGVRSRTQAALWYHDLPIVFPRRGSCSD